MALSTRQTTVVFTVCILLVAALAAYLRLPELARRPMHCDEAVHTVKAGELIDTGKYVYDPHEYHGPTIYYFALPFVWARGVHDFVHTDETMFRIVPVLFGIALVLLVLAVGDGLGRTEAVVAAALVAVSPAMAFYSRYYIQEIPFVCFTFGMLASGWRYARTRALGWAVAFGVFAGLMHATKETCVLVWFAMVVALAVTWLMAPRYGAARWSWRELAPSRVIVLAVIPGLLVSAAFLTGFFTNPRGFLDGFLTYASYFKRADGAGIHDHPWYYYLSLLAYSKFGPGPFWSEGLILGLAAIGAGAAFRTRAQFRGNGAFVRFLAVYTAVLTAVYCLIPYKTPWCALGFLHGMILLAGYGAVTLVSALRWRPLQAVAILLLAAGTWQLYTQTVRTNGRYCADMRNPYVYAHTSTDFMRFVTRMQDLAAVAPEGRDMLVRVITADCWPIPWYLRAFTRVGYWQAPGDDTDASVVVTSPELAPDVQARFKQAYQSEFYGLRPDVPIAVYIRQDLWDRFMKTRE